MITTMTAVLLGGPMDGTIQQISSDRPVVTFNAVELRDALYSAMDECGLVPTYEVAYRRCRRRSAAGYQVFEYAGERVS